MIEETLCPECGGKMVSRTSRTGVFWGCRDYPRCRGTRNTDGESREDQRDRLPSDWARDNDRSRWSR